MKSRKTVASIAAVTATVAAGTAIGFGQGDPPSGPGASAAAPAAVSAKAVAVAAPSSPVVGRAAAKAKKKVSIAYFETKKPLNLKGGQQYFKFKANACPKHSKAIDGYMFYGGQSVPTAYVIPAGDAPSGARNWQFYLSNPNTEPSVNEGIKFGIICAKNVG